ncbi:MAG: hypothetical protein ABR559_04875 [Gemmatimonadota bacterium]
MSPLRCSTARDALWERAASAGPAPLSPALGDHLAACPACQAEARAVGDLLAVSRGLADPAPPTDLWDDFDLRLDRRIAGSVWLRTWNGWGRRAAGIAALLALGFALGSLVTGGALRSADRVAAIERREARVAELQAQLATEARLEAYLAEMEALLAPSSGPLASGPLASGPLVPDRAAPSGLLAGSGVVPADQQRIEQQRLARERLRALVAARLADEAESDSRGFAYLERRIAAIAGQQLLYFVP